MRKIPECLSRRYKAADDLMKELSRTPESGCSSPNSAADDPGVRLMCQFWNILKAHPELNLQQAVKERMEVSSDSSHFCLPQRFACYMACGKKDDDKEKSDRPKHESCCKPDTTPNCGRKMKNVTSPEQAESATCCKNAIPLTEVLGNLNKAASADKVCNTKINELLATQKKLLEQIKYLEEKEKKGIKLLKEVDCMWMCMEDMYKKKLIESLDRQNALLNELKETEASNIKWRKNQKDLELEMVHLNKCDQEITDKINQKTNDLKCINIEMENFKKRISTNKYDLEAAKKKNASRKKDCENKIAKMSANVNTLQRSLQEQRKLKKDKESEGSKYIRQARDDLQNLSKVLLQKKFENENLIAERDALINDIELLNDTADQCKEKCKDKEKAIEDEIEALTLEIKEFQPRCIHCQKCTDTIDIRRFCVDCPRCVKERHCLIKDDQCYLGTDTDCVCMYVKQKFLDNVFENMYTVLERHTKTGPGKSIAKAVLNCLKKSRNGKLDRQTRQVLQDFIVSTVGKNLNLTIIGGAVKTRCELDQDTYKQLMLCLNKITATRPPIEHKGTAAKKDSCPRWGATSECNCPKGPKNCICSKKAPSAGYPPGHCYQKPTKDDNTEIVVCPHNNSSCGRECAIHSITSVIGSEMSSWKPSPCQGPSCKLKNMRAAQCVVESEKVSSLSNAEDLPTTSYAPDTSVLGGQITCDCGSSPIIPCSCRQGLQSNQLKAEIGNQYSISFLDNVIKLEKNEKQEFNKNIKSSNIATDNINIMFSKCCQTSDKIPTISKTASGNLQVAINNTLFKLIKDAVDEHSNTKETRQNKFVVDSDEDKKIISSFIDNVIKLENNEKQDFNKNIKSSNIATENINIMFGKCCQTSDKIPTISKTASGNLQVAINNTLFKLIKDAVDEHSNTKETRQNKFVVDSDEDKKINSKYKDNSVSCISLYSSNLKQNKTDTDITNKLTDTIQEVPPYNKANKKFFLKTIDMSEQKNKKIKVELGNKGKKDISGHLFRTLSGNLAIDLRDCINKDQGIEKESKKNVVIPEKETKSEHNENCKKNNPNISPHCKPSIYPVIFKGFANSFIESLIALNIPDIGEYKVILNKEFEENIKKIVKNCNVCESDQFIILLKLTTSKRCLIDLEPNNTEPGNAVMVKNSSGDIKIIVNDPDSQNLNEIITRGKCSVISRTYIKDMLSKLLVEKQRTSSCPRGNNFLKIGNINSESSSFLNGIDPGSFTINFNDNAKTSTWVTEAAFSNDQEMPNNTKAKLNFNKRCKSLKISPRGSIYIMIDDDQYSDSITSSSINSMKSYIKSSLTNCILKMKANKKVSFRDERLWDTLDNLPPQLPPFLKGYTNT